MTIEILMPALSPTMTEGKLVKWHKAEGDAVDSGDVLAEIETDKATMEIEAVDEGVLGRILVAEGSEGVKVNTAIAVLLEEGEEGTTVTAPAAPAPAPAPTAAPTPAPAPVAPAAPVAPPVAAPARADNERIIASPLARRMGTQAGLDLSRIAGSGPHGRIVKRDIEAALSGQPQKPAATPAAAPVVSSDQPYTEVPNSTMRQVIARRLGESKRDIPHFYLSVDCELDALLGLRADLNGRGEGTYKLSVNDFVVRAVALALAKVPGANATWTDAAVRLYERVDVSVAVATPHGLITPIVRNADAKGLAAISNEMKDLSARAKDSKLMPEDYQGGGFTISNLGMYGIKEFAAVINPPQSCILAVGAGEKRPIVKDGALAIATVMTVTLSVDHRSVDGAVAADFLSVFKGFIEDPLTMLL
jgi:pyruvate dehydrogenase E2 component (dihydrolipoamide acetyltransferase)